MTLVMQATIREAAQRLAEYNIQVSPDLKAIYLFPAEHEIRLVEVDPVTIPSEDMTPFYFGADPRSGIPYPNAIVLIRPEEQFVLSPPAGWGGWDVAVKLWPKE